MGKPPIPVDGTESPIDPQTNPHEQEIAPNIWEKTAFGAGMGEAMKKFFGRSFDLDKLIKYTNAIHRKDKAEMDKIPLKDLVAIALMGIYYMRNRGNDAFAADNLEYYLVAGRDKPAGSDRVVKRLSEHPLLDHTEFHEELCGDHFPKLLAEIQARITAPAGTLFPAETRKMWNDQGEVLEIPPAETTLGAGGTENIYVRSILHHPDTFYALGNFNVASRIGVKTAAAPRGDVNRMTVTVEIWRAWGWDKYDWHSGIPAGIPIDNLDEIAKDLAGQTGAFDGDILASKFRSWITIDKGLDPGIFTKDGISVAVNDYLLKRLHGQEIELDGKTYKPYEYEIYLKSWLVTTGRSCLGDLKSRTFEYDRAQAKFVATP